MLAPIGSLVQQSLNLNNLESFDFFFFNSLWQNIKQTGYHQIQV